MKEDIQPILANHGDPERMLQTFFGGGASHGVWREKTRPTRNNWRRTKISRCMYDAADSVFQPSHRRVARRLILQNHSNARCYIHIGNIHIGIWI